MAAGSSAPEVATSIVTVFTTQDSTGIGTILGSAVFNLVMIVAMSGLFGAGPRGTLREKCEAAHRASGASSTLPQGLFLDWRPFTRDCLFYVVSLIMCCSFAVTEVGDWYNAEVDSRPGFRWWEGLVLSLSYVVYIAAMVKNDELMACLKNTCGMQAHIKVYTEEMEKRRGGDDDDDDEEGDEEGTGMTPLRRKGSGGGGLRFLDADGRVAAAPGQQSVPDAVEPAPRRAAHEPRPAHFSGGLKFGVNVYEKETPDESKTAAVSTDGVELQAAAGNISFGDDGLGSDGYQRPEYIADAARDAALSGHAVNAPAAHYKLKAIDAAVNDGVDGDDVEESETVRLLVSEVVRLRDTVVDLQSRMIPLQKRTIGDYRPYRKSDIPAGSEGAPQRTYVPLSGLRHSVACYHYSQIQAVHLCFIDSLLYIGAHALCAVLCFFRHG